MVLVAWSVIVVVRGGREVSASLIHLFIGCQPTPLEPDIWNVSRNRPWPPRPVLGSLTGGRLPERTNGTASKAVEALVVSVGSNPTPSARYGQKGFSPFWPFRVELVGADKATVSREVKILIESGIATTLPSPGNSKLVAADESLPWHDELRRILAHTGGVIPALTEIVRTNPDIVDIWVYGSWARRYHGERGHFPRDLDLVVATEASAFDVDEVFFGLGQELNIEVNTKIFEPGVDPDTLPLVAGTPTVRIGSDG